MHGITAGFTAALALPRQPAALTQAAIRPDRGHPPARGRARCAGSARRMRDGSATGDPGEAESFQYRQKTFKDVLQGLFYLRKPLRHSMDIPRQPTLTAGE